MTNEELWRACLAELELNISPTHFKTWFVESSLLSKKESLVELGFKNAYTKQVIEDRYHGQIKTILERLTGEKINLIFKVVAKPEKKIEEKNMGPLFQAPKETPQKTREESNLFSQYTFENFVVGSNNNLAHAVAVAIANKPGKAYNPFFLYSQVGLGKTHLIQAIGNKILETGSQLKVLYCTGESFANELIDAIQSGDRAKTEKFRRKFRSVDVWLIDDAQFIAGRESTQEEFFHTFNHLYQAQKQIVLTSDRPPRDIAKLEERLSSRFAGGMIADMQPPDIDVRVAILRRKREQENLQISDEALELIAQKSPPSIRELQGLLLQVSTIARSQGAEITAEVVYKVLGGHQNNAEKKLAPKDIIQAVCTYYSVRQKDLKGERRLKEIAFPRQVAMYCLRRFAGIPFMGAGELLGGRDHSTIIHGVDKIEKALQEDAKVKQDVANIRQTLGI